MINPMCTLFFCDMFIPNYYVICILELSGNGGNYLRVFPSEKDYFKPIVCLHSFAIFFCSSSLKQE